MNEKAEKLLRDSGFRTGIERVECLPFPGCILPFTGFVNQTKNGQRAIKVIFSPGPPRREESVEEKLPMLFESNERGGPLILLRLLLERINHNAATEFRGWPAVKHALPRKKWSFSVRAYQPMQQPVTRMVFQERVESCRRENLFINWVQNPTSFPHRRYLERLNPTSQRLNHVFAESE